MKAGLENNEFCIWITSPFIKIENIYKAMRETIPDFELYLKMNQLEIFPHTEWYIKDGVLDLKGVLNGWVKKTEMALTRNYAGLRATGCVSSLNEKDHAIWLDYEREINHSIGKYPMIALCIYPLNSLSLPTTVAAAYEHQFVLIKQQDNVDLKLIKNPLSEQLETSMTHHKGELQTIQKQTDKLTKKIRLIPWVADENCKIITLGKSVEDVLGYPPADWYIENFWMEHIYPDDRLWVTNYSRTCTDYDKDYEFEFRMIAADGSIIWLHNIFNVVLGSKDKRFFRGYLLDITGQKRLEDSLKNMQIILEYQIAERTRALREKNKSLKQQISENVQIKEQLSVFSTAAERWPAMVIITDPKGIIKYTNLKFTEVTGYTLEEAVGETLYSLKSKPTPTEEYQWLWDTLLSGKEWSGELLYRCA